MSPLAELVTELTRRADAAEAEATLSRASMTEAWEQAHALRQELAALKAAKKGVRS